MRNIQRNLIPKWNSGNKISELISLLPDFCNGFEYQIEQGLLPSIGDYMINSYKYDINDFFRNPTNNCFRIVVPNKNYKENVTYFYPRFFVVTSRSFLLMESVDEKYKNICRINYVGDLYAIEKIEKFINTDEEYKDLSCFKIRWNKKYSNPLDMIMCGDVKTFVVKNICDCLEKRREKIKKHFKFIEKNEDVEIDTYEKIIEIKKKLVEDKINDAIYEDINNLYQKIIEILASLSGDDFKKYVKSLQDFINKYDSLKTKGKDIKKPSNKK
jgi:hypothetical protein